MPEPAETTFAAAESEPGRPGVYRVVFHSDTRVRIRRTPTDEPGTWRFNFHGVEDSPGDATVIARDWVRTDEAGIQWPEGLEVIVELEADSCDAAVAAAESLAETGLFFLACSRRAPVRQAMLHVAYEITPGNEEHAFAQMFWRFPIPDGQTTVDPAALDALWKSIGAADARTMRRVIQSMSWYRLGLEEADPVMRFSRMWLAAEALDPLLRTKFQIAQFEEGEPCGECGRRATVPSNGGLRELERQLADNPESVTGVRDALKLRWALFHVRKQSRDTLAGMAVVANPPLEDLIVGGWSTLLGLDHSALPRETIGPETTNLMLEATIVGGDVDLWAAGDHPHMVLKQNPAVLLEAEAPGTQTTTASPEFGFVNIPLHGIRDPRRYFKGPQGNLGMRFHDPHEQEPESPG